MVNKTEYFECKCGRKVKTNCIIPFCFIVGVGTVKCPKCGADLTEEVYGSGKEAEMAGEISEDGFLHAEISTGKNQ